MIQRLPPLAGGLLFLAVCATSLPAQAPAAGAAAGAARLQEVVLQDSTFGRARRLWVHTPQGYDARASAYPLVIAFDGAEYRDTIPLPLMLDTLRAAGKLPPVIAVLIDDSTGAVRIAELGNARKLVRFLEEQVLPYVRAHWHVTTDPRRVLVTGSSAGGLAAAFVAIERPDLFGNVLAQSGAFWRGAEASNSAPWEWLTTRVLSLPKLEVRFFLDVGELETQAVLGGTGPVFIEANRRFRDALAARGYQLTYTEVPGGRHNPATWAARLPVGLVSLAGGWQ